MAISWLSIALVCLAANLFVHQLEALPGLQWAVPLGLTFISVAHMRGDRRRMLGAAIAAFAWTWLQAVAALGDRLPSASSGRDFSVEGWIDDFPDREAGRTVFSFRVDRSSEASVPKRLRLTWYDPPVTLEAGQPLSLEVRLRTPRGLVNPGGFDYERWLLVEAYGATGYVRGFDSSVAPRIQDPRRGLLIWRREVAQRIAMANLGRDAEALIAALALGERGGFDDEHWRVLRVTGTSHLVAISGMHVGLIGALVFFATRRSCLRYLPHHLADYDLEISAAASAAAAIAYAAMAGFALPTQRAAIMLAIALTVAIARRVTRPLDGLGLALLVVLFVDPLATLTASFWLSFGAVSILLLQADCRVAASSFGFVGRIARYFREFTRLQWAVTIALVPMLSAFFGELSLISPAVNFVAIPVFSLVLVPLALLAVLLSVVEARWSFALEAVGWVADFVWRMLAAVAEWPKAAVAMPQAPVMAVVIGAVAVFMAVDWHRLPGRRMAILGLLPLLWPAQKKVPQGSVDVLMLDVGHGLAVLLATANHRLLYDAGPVTRSGFDAGREIVLPALASRGEGSLDMLILSHGDSDHSGGAPAVVDAYPAADVLKGPDVDTVPGEICRAGQGWVWDGVGFEILHPARKFSGSGNDSSCVLKVSTSRRSLLLTGDIEARAESTLAGRIGISADIVSVPHHGSGTSSGPAFVNAVGARLALVSAGFDNRWGFPKPEVARRWRATGAQVVTTGDSGAIAFRLGPTELELQVERNRRPRYWREGAVAVPGETPGDAL